MLQRLWAMATALLLAALSPPALAEKFKFATLEFPPYTYAENDDVKGFNIEIVREAFRLMGHEVEVKLYPIQRGIELVKSGGIDGIFTLYKNTEREQFLFYSNEPLHRQKMTLWVPKNSKVSFDGDLDKLKPYRFGVVRWISYGEKFDAMVKAGELQTQSASDVKAVIKMLLSDRADIWVTNHIGAVWDLKRAGLYDTVKELSPPIQETAGYVTFSKALNRAGLRDEFDKALLTMKNNGFYDAVLNRYLNPKALPQ